jgi:hypothetical protein
MAQYNYLKNFNAIKALPLVEIYLLNHKQNRYFICDLNKTFTQSNYYVRKIFTFYCPM